ncbi:family 78 glycoside hydrolase catalytic domain [Candidatus Halobonum tyrrellensis]|uniref:alpha-L-rhamnosidase n=1 Tax=Candidatus Halobonum tyrrellensis G22 TaxID=1324957 RepID=V4H8H7_9EURY|nr:family 78 glycoside hydrolase catalytic domain [Candidatus Halobonum tyrrellensis]ESP87015.1 alpha-L-rhamnosidase [Candidatus Halobonum tyrrellensis G22]
MSDQLRPARLRTEFAENPPGIDARTPDLRWRVDADRRGARQTGFRLLVASTPETLAADEGDVWAVERRGSRPAVEYDGPALESEATYHWKVRVRDEAGEWGPWSDPARWGTGPLDADDWEAAWIRRSGENAFERGQFSYFRRSFDLPGADANVGTDGDAEREVVRARAFVSASHQYTLSVNGETVDRGQAFDYPDSQYYRTVEVGDALRAGENVVGALHTWNGEGQGRPAAEPGFLLRLVVEFADGSRRVVTTDDSWRVREGPWLDAPLRNDEIAEPVERIDGRRVPHGWDEPGFDADADDGEWADAAAVGTHPTEPWERLVAQVRDVDRRAVDPESVTRLDSPDADGDVYVVDFGRVYAGVPVVRFASGTDGHRVRMRAGYRLDDDGDVDPTEGTQWTDMRYAYVQPDGASEFRPFNYLGFRYLRVEAPGEELSEEQVGLVASHNAVPDERAATFESSDPGVDDVFELARHSALYGSQEQFVDTPTREKGQFLADSLNVSRVTTRAFGERRLSRASVREFVESHYRYWASEGRLNAVYPNGDGKRDIPDFTVSFPEWVWQYYRTADDPATLVAAYPVVRAIADYVVRHVDPETGLVTRLSGGEGGPYEEGIVDWPAEMRYGYDREWPARTTVNFLSANALRRAADVAAELGQPEAERAYYRDAADGIDAAIDDRLRDGERYVDGADAAGASDHASQHANALALALGHAPDAAADAVADRVVEDGMAMGPMMVPWLLRALDAADRPAAMVDLLTDPTHDGWADILAEGGTFTWETWAARDPDLPDDERHNRSESHAMGATVLVSIQRTLLGVSVAESGGARVRVAPPAEGLETASGTVPTERGPVSVAWERADGAFELDVSVPVNAAATVSLPPADGAAVTVNGETVDPGADSAAGSSDDDGARSLPEGVDAVGSSDGRAEVEVGSGEYAFVARE